MCKLVVGTARGQPLRMVSCCEVEGPAPGWFQNVLTTAGCNAHYSSDDILQTCEMLSGACGASPIAKWMQCHSFSPTSWANGVLETPMGTVQVAECAGFDKWDFAARTTFDEDGWKFVDRPWEEIALRYIALWRPQYKLDPLHHNTDKVFALYHLVEAARNQPPSEEEMISAATLGVQAV